MQTWQGCRTYPCAHTSVRGKFLEKYFLSLEKIKFYGQVLIRFHKCEQTLQRLCCLFFSLKFLVGENFYKQLSHGEILHFPDRFCTPVCSSLKCMQWTNRQSSFFRSIKKTFNICSDLTILWNVSLFVDLITQRFSLLHIDVVFFSMLFLLPSFSSAFVIGYCASVSSYLRFSPDNSKYHELNH